MVVQVDFAPNRMAKRFAELLWKPIFYFKYDISQMKQEARTVCLDSDEIYLNGDSLGKEKNIYPFDDS